MNLTSIFFPIYYVYSIFIFDIDLQNISNSTNITNDTTSKTNLRIGYLNFIDDDYNDYYYDDLEYNIYNDDLVV